MGVYINHGLEYVHPTFLYESIADFLIFLILIKASNSRKYSGQIAVIYFSLYSLARFWIEGLRTDSLMIGMFRISQIVSIIMFGLAVIYRYKLKNKQK